MPNRTTWSRILFNNNIAVGEKPGGIGGQKSIPGQSNAGILDEVVIVILKTSRDHITGKIREIDEDFLVLETEDRKSITAIVSLDEVVGFRTR